MRSGGGPGWSGGSAYGQRNGGPLFVGVAGSAYPVASSRRLVVPDDQPHGNGQRRVGRPRGRHRDGRREATGPVAVNPDPSRGGVDRHSDGGRRGARPGRELDPAPARRRGPGQRSGPEVGDLQHLAWGQDVPSRIPNEGKASRADSDCLHGCHTEGCGSRRAGRSIGSTRPEDQGRDDEGEARADLRNELPEWDGSILPSLCEFCVNRVLCASLALPVP